MDPALVLGGFAVGAVVGLTGMGGGALMTPLLIFLGVPPATAVGTDLAYAALIKTAAGWVYHRRGNVVWPVAARLLAGGVPGTAAGLVLLASWQVQGLDPGAVVRPALAVALVLTGIVLLAREVRRLRPPPRIRRRVHRHRGALAVAAGVGLGLLLALSSVGAGAFGTAALLVLHRGLAPVAVVGTGIAWAAPLAVLGAAGHLGLGTVDLALLALLAVGALPGVALGARVGDRLPASALRRALAVVLVAVGLGQVL